MLQGKISFSVTVAKLNMAPSRREIDCSHHACSLPCNMHTHTNNNNKSNLLLKLFLSISLRFCRNILNITERKVIVNVTCSYLKNSNSGADMCWNCSLSDKSTKFGGKLVFNVLTDI